MAHEPESLGSQNLAFIEEMYEHFLSDPQSVSKDWRLFFAGQEAEPVRLGSSFKLRSIFNPAGSQIPSTRRIKPSVRVFTDPQQVESRLAFLKPLPVFRGLGTEELRHVAEIAEPRSCVDGECFVKQGEQGRDMYVITRGEAEIRRSGRVVTRFGPGDVVGEMALFDAEERSADAVAIGQIELLRISGDALLDLIDANAGLARGLIRVLTKRLRDTGTRQDRVDQLIRAYRVRGHLMANLDPLGQPKDLYPELNPSYYGFWQGDMDTLFSATTIPGATVLSLRAILGHLKNTYCRSIAVQFMHIDNLRNKMWLQDRMETTQNEIHLSREKQIRILTKLTDAEMFEQFIHRKFVGAKRFSLEGAESLIPLLDLAIEAAGASKVEEVVIGMAHRGRLNVLANIMGKSPRKIFAEFDDNHPERFLGKGDVKYHLGYSDDRITDSGNKVHLSLAFNPSHLEFVSAVVAGRVRAKQDQKQSDEHSKVMGIVIHGDAAFAGQGVVQEIFNLSQLEGYNTGGTLHIVVNNQIGFTTDPKDGRSTQYATSVAKMLQIPIFHVNGENPEAVAQAVTLAMEFRETFKRDVVIDMYCYRRLGHNEGDEPSFTQPDLYARIKKRKTVREAYLDNLYKLGEITRESADQISKERRERLETELGLARSDSYSYSGTSAGQAIWQGYNGGPDKDTPDVKTGVSRARLQELLHKLATVPAEFTPHSKVKRLLAAKHQMADGELPLDWAAGEALAFATLLTEGSAVRLSGQDAQRGTFSHRHAVLHDQRDGSLYTPLKNLENVQARFGVFNSPLSEIGVLGYEYGYSLDTPRGLNIWEAQFGDFANVAQVIIDQFIVSGEDKWERWSGLVMLLPHGFEGQGPEHSSGRPERFLASAAEDNIQVANVTTPAQIFHLLRRQVHRVIRKPLVVMSPKSLLRHPKAVSDLSELSSGRFKRYIGDVAPKADPKAVRKILFTSGKIYYELEEERAKREAWDVAILRMEQYYPIRHDKLEKLLSPYPDGAPIVWVQEEPRNKGPWPFLHFRFASEMLGHPLSAVARKVSASPATGSAAAHRQEQAAIIAQAFE